MKFIDEVEIEVSSGHGGPGCVSFRREAKVPRGGPDGGDGGRGGHVVFKVNPQKQTLLDLRFKKKYKAPNGDPGQGNQRSGADGEDLVIEIPPGTEIIDTESNETHDLTEPEQSFVIEGGKGGKGNVFYKSSVNQAPGFAQKGLPGQSRSLSLKLKLIADVGLIGFPNVGKSTFISHISAARPKVADYPFTTLAPNLGVVQYRDNKSFVVADIPGIIGGAHAGKGLGLQFLKHIERTKIFVHLLDVSGMSGRDPIDDFQIINSELKEYEENFKVYPKLSSRPQIVALNKADVGNTELLERAQNWLKDQGIHSLPLSAVSGEGIQDLLHEIGRVVFKESTEEQNEKSRNLRWHV